MLLALFRSEIILLCFVDYTINLVETTSLCRVFLRKYSSSLYLKFSKAMSNVWHFSQKYERLLLSVDNGWIVNTGAEKHCFSAKGSQLKTLLKTEVNISPEWNERNIKRIINGTKSFGLEMNEKQQRFERVRRFVFLGVVVEEQVHKNKNWEHSQQKGIKKIWQS